MRPAEAMAGMEADARSAAAMPSVAARLLHVAPRPGDTRSPPTLCSSSPGATTGRTKRPVSGELPVICKGFSGLGGSGFGGPGPGIRLEFPGIGVPGCPTLTTEDPLSRLALGPPQGAGAAAARGCGEGALPGRGQRLRCEVDAYSCPARRKREWHGQTRRRRVWPLLGAADFGVRSGRWATSWNASRPTS
jgi:hypothetical protein